MIWQILCKILPWHHIVKTEYVSNQADLLTCSCGRKYGWNHDIMIMLPWDRVRDFDEWDIEWNRRCQESWSRYSANRSQGERSET